LPVSIVTASLADRTDLKRLNQLSAMARELIEPDRKGFASPDSKKKIYWEYYGPGKREVICLLNGLAMHTGSWNSALPNLLDEYDILLHDYIGQGQSTSDEDSVDISELGDDLILILDQLDIDRIHLLGISYGGFVALDMARRHQQRLCTLTLSGILLSHEKLFDMYQEISLRFFRAGAIGFELYTHYLYEKIFGEAFVRSATPYLEKMRLAFSERFQHRVHGLIRLTEAQNPFFAQLDDHMSGFLAIQTPTLILAGDDDRVILPRIQRKIPDILPCTRFEPIANSGHVVFLEQPEIFFGLMKRFCHAKSTEF
jgi:3-oxoadipate enol-lactonase